MKLLNNVDTASSEGSTTTTDTVNTMSSDDTVEKKANEDHDHHLIELCEKTLARDSKISSFASHDENSVVEWLTKTVPDHDFCCFFDAHVVMEYLYRKKCRDCSIADDRISDLAKRSELRDNLGLGSLRNLETFMSFESSVPTLISTGEYKNNTPKGKSCFANIPDYEAWFKFQMKISDELTNLQNSLNSLLLERVDESFKHMLSIALLSSVNWIRHWIVMFDVLYRELLPKIGDAMAFHVASLIYCNIWEIVGESRLGVRFHHSTEKEKVCPVVFCSVAKAHKVMERFEKNNFHRDPEVTGKLHHLINDYLFEDLSSKNERIVELEKKTEELEAKSKSQDELIEALSRRLEALEDGA